MKKEPILYTSDGFPIARCIIRDGQIVVLRCPLCGRRHIHGLGNDPEKPLLGLRCAHCIDGHSGSYDLILDGEGC